MKAVARSAATGASAALRCSGIPAAAAGWRLGAASGCTVRRWLSSAGSGGDDVWETVGTTGGAAAPKSRAGGGGGGDGGGGSRSEVLESAVSSVPSVPVCAASAGDGGQLDADRSASGGAQQQTQQGRPRSGSDHRPPMAGGSLAASREMRQHNTGVRETTAATELRADQRRAQLRQAATGNQNRAEPRRQAPHKANRFTTTMGKVPARAPRAGPATREADPSVVPTVSFLGWATWNRDGRLPHAVQDQQMDKAAQAAFGPTARAATWEEYEGNLVSGSPALNESDLWLHFTGDKGHGYDNGKGYQWKKCVWRKRALNGHFSEDSCSASVCSAMVVKPILQ